MFIGREKELKELNRLYKTNKFQFAVIYGRRRVGKTALINEFIKDKDAIVFTGLEIDAQTNLENLSKNIFEFENLGDSAPIFGDFQLALEYVYKLSQKKRIVFVIDEYPYLAKSYPGISSILQVQIDHKFKNKNIFLIFCGSSMSFMEKQVLGYRSPLYGRRTAQFKIKPFEFFESNKFFKKFGPQDLAVIYGVTGGVPQYLSQMDDALTLEENIKNAFLSPSAFLFEKPTNLLKQEVRDPTTYNAVIKAIATGCSRNSEIANKVNISTSACSEYLNNLVDLGIVKKEIPIVKVTYQKAIYVLEDGMFKFWYRFIPGNLQQIQRGFPDKAYKRIEPQIPSFMGKVFEDICGQYLWKLLLEEKAPIDFENVSRWWGSDPVKKCEVEIDIIANESNESAIFAECKWTNEKLDLSTIENLIEKSELFRYKNRYFYLFSKSGFTKACIDKAKENKNIKLLAFEEMLD
ncbi:MAG: ATP-binding protein [Firmicutes bacterium]|nr:ATP-binding protein [Bacillota bacterium]